MTPFRHALVKTIEALFIYPKVKTATSYLSETLTIRATHRGKNRGEKGGRKRRKHVEINLTVGKPNYGSREYIKSLKKSGERFPVRRVHLKFSK